YSLFLLILFFVLNAAARLFHFAPLIIPAYVSLVYCAFRFFSRKHDRRQAENARFMSLVQSVTRWFHLKYSRHMDKQHRYFKCPNCGQQLRVPRGKGKIQVFCRTCGTHFEAKS
ncbi:MAG: hypothetical protein RR053_02425, partial [Evtepia sp.]